MCIQTSVGPQNIAGFEAVQRLAHYLVSLAGNDFLTTEQVAEVTRLSGQLDAYDKRRVRYPPRHRTRLSLGRFAQSKNTVTPGTDSIRR